MSRKQIYSIISLFVGCTLASMSFDNPVLQRTAVICVLCLGLWLTELIPLYATTLVLLFSIPLLLSPIHADFFFSKVLLWPANSVLALFFGGFALGVAGKKYGIDGYMARIMLKLASGNPARLILLIMIGTAMLSMWMSNLAASAMMLAALRPIWTNQISSDVRKAALLSIAFGANLGGIATPIGTGPNAIAIAAIQDRVSFVEWMLFALPLTAVMLTITYLLLRLLYSIRVPLTIENIPISLPTKRMYVVMGVFFFAVLLWLLEPFHGIPAAAIAIGVAAVLFATRLLVLKDLAEIDWPTLILIAGGLTLGELIDRSGLAKALGSSIPWHSISRNSMILILVFSGSFLSSIASNTAASILLIQLGRTVDPSPNLPILIALGASMGAPFIISTPPNAMVYGEGGLSARDLLIPGLILMIFGCVLVALTGSTILGFVGL
jgi:solute carrier family 13 (sodium-dependent dicarboxylate transporter), member 2/3/5